MPLLRSLHGRSSLGFMGHVSRLEAAARLLRAHLRAPRRDPDPPRSRLEWPDGFRRGGRPGHRGDRPRLDVESGGDGSPVPGRADALADRVRVRGSEPRRAAGLRPAASADASSPRSLPGRHALASCTSGVRRGRAADGRGTRDGVCAAIAAPGARVRKARRTLRPRPRRRPAGCGLSRPGRRARRARLARLGTSGAPGRPREPPRCGRRCWEWLGASGTSPATSPAA